MTPLPLAGFFQSPRRYNAPIGECCGRTFYSWEGWFLHLRRHRSAA